MKLALRLSLGNTNYVSTPGFNPANIEGLSIHLADSVTIVDGGVDVWNDLSGNSNHARAVLPANRPAYGADQINGIDVLSFDGTNHYLVFDGFPTTGSMFVVFDSKVDTNFILIAGAGGSDYTPIALQGSTSTTIHSMPGSNTFYIDGQLQAWTNRGDTYNAMNGVHLLGIVPCNVSDFSTLNINGYTNSTSRLAGNFAEFVMYNRTLASEERQQVEQYLINKWGISV